MKCKGRLIFYLLFFCLFLSNSISAFAVDYIDSDALKKLKEKQQLYFDDFKVLENNQWLVYVIDKNNGDTVYPKRIKNDDLLTLQNKIKSNQIKDFNKEFMLDTNNKYQVYDLQSKDGHNYLIFVEPIQVKVTFSSNKSPYDLYIEGQSSIMRINGVKEVNLAKGNKYEVKAVHDNSEKELTVDLTKENLKTDYNIKFGLSNETWILICGICLLFVVLGLFLFWRGREKTKPSKTPIVNDPESEPVKETSIPIDTVNSPIIQVGNNYFGLNYLMGNLQYFGEEINKFKRNNKTLYEKLDRLKETVIKGQSKIIEGVSILEELVKLEDEIKDAVNFNKQLNIDIEKLEKDYRNLDNLKENSKLDVLKELCISLNSIIRDSNRLYSQAYMWSDKISYIQVCVTNSNHPSSNIEKAFKEIGSALFKMAEAIENGHNDLKQDLKLINDNIENFKCDIDGTMSNLNNDLDLIMLNLNKIKSTQDLNDVNNQALIKNTLENYYNREQIYIEQLSILEEKLESIENSFGIEISRSLKNILSKEKIEVRQTLEKTDENFVEKIKSLIKEDKTYKDRFKNLDNASITLLSEGDFLMNILNKSQWVNYSSVYLCYIKTVERELSNILNCEERGLGSYISMLKSTKQNKWLSFIEEIKLGGYIKDRNSAAHTHLITKEKAEGLKDFLLNKDTSYGQGWLSLINAEKSNI